jgi:hypothetical protein
VASGYLATIETATYVPGVNYYFPQTINHAACDGPLTARVVHSFRGDAELAVRVILREVPTARWKEFVVGFDRSSGVDGDIGDYRISDPSATKQPFTIEYDVTKAGFADRTRKTSSLMLPHSALEMPEQPAPEDDIELGSPARAQYRLRLEFGDGFALRAPQSVTVARDYGDYKATYAVDGRTFSAERILDLRVGELPAARGSDYAATCATSGEAPPPPANGLGRHRCRQIRHPGRGHARRCRRAATQ